MAARKATKQVEPELEADVQDQVESTADESDLIEFEQDEPATLEQERKCPKHAQYFPGESIMRPISEFRVRKDGKLASTYCRRCDGKMHTDYSRRKRAERLDDAEHLQALIDRKLAELADLEMRLQCVQHAAEVPDPEPEPEPERQPRARHETAPPARSNEPFSPYK
jgi:hypothetical protein